MKDICQIDKQLGEVIANKGVPPFVLANNISLNNYSEVTLYKNDNFIIVDMYCIDEETGQNMMFRYKYSLDETLLTKEMVIAGRTSLIWDRDKEIKNLIRRRNDVVSAI